MVAIEPLDQTLCNRLTRRPMMKRPFQVRGRLRAFVTGIEVFFASEAHLHHYPLTF